MIYAAAISLLILSHLIYYTGQNGSRISIKLEKIVVFIATIVSFGAIVELGAFLASLSNQHSEWIPSMLIYPAGLILFLFVIFVCLPKPIQEKKPNKTEHSTASRAVVRFSDNLNH